MYRFANDITREVGILQRTYILYLIFMIINYYSFKFLNVLIIYLILMFRLIYMYEIQNIYYAVPYFTYYLIYIAGDFKIALNNLYVQLIKI